MKLSPALAAHVVLSVVGIWLVVRALFTRRHHLLIIILLLAAGIVISGLIYLDW